MDPSLAVPGQIVDVWSAWSDGEERAVVLRTREMEVLRLHLARGSNIPTHESQGQMIILCVQGRVRVNAQGQSYELNSGQLLYLLVHEPFDLFGLEESSLLLTVLTSREVDAEELIGQS